MDTLCRLCYTINKNPESMCKLTVECDILCKIRSWLPFNLPIDEALPNHICCKCVYKIEEINALCTKIKENEEILQKHLKEGSLFNYYSNLNKEFLIKEDRTQYQQRVCSEDSIVKSENYESYNDKRNINNGNKINKTSNEVIIVNKRNITNGMYNDSAETNKNNYIEFVKAENETNNDFNDIAFSSTDEEDNVKLSSLKNVEEITEKCENKSTENQKNYIEKMKITDSKKPILDEYSCLMCDKVCNSHDKLKQHYKQEHTNKINQISELIFSEIVSDGITMYKCNQCDKVYNKKYMKRHILSHTNDRPYACKLCKRTYRTVSDIMRHSFRVHSGLKLLCPFKCGFSSAYTGAIKEHENRVHKYKFKYTCEKCGKGFQVKTWFIQHQNVHTGLKPYVCDICGAAFHMDKYLKMHRNTIHPQATDMKDLICSHCNLKCETDNILETHLKTEHGIIRTKRYRKKKKTLCDLCGKILNRPEELIVHRRMHLGEKPYKCSICSKSFPRKFSMQVHERAHSRLRPHACTRCGRTYSQPSALYRHQRKQHALPQKPLKTADET